MSFFSDSSKDKEDLKGTTVTKKFQTVIDTLNFEAFQSRGTLKMLNEKDFSLSGPNQLIESMYSAGSLIVNWYFMHEGKKVTLESNISNARNVSEREQYLFAVNVVERMNHKML